MADNGGPVRVILNRCSLGFTSFGITQNWGIPKKHTVHSSQAFAKMRSRQILINGFECKCHVLDVCLSVCLCVRLCTEEPSSTY